MSIVLNPDQIEDKGDYYYVDEDVLFEVLAEYFERDYPTDFATAFRQIARAHTIRTSDLVGQDNMIGARVTFVDQDGDPHRAIVLEPEVNDIGASEAYDPRKGEMVDPSNYPLGTVQLIRGDGWELGTDSGFFDRLVSDHGGRGLTSETSVPPATGPDDTYCYFASWEAAPDGDDAT